MSPASLPRRASNVVASGVDMRHVHDIRARQTLHYAFDSLHALSCGCVAAVYRTQPLDTEVVSLEARGPHCLYPQHVQGRVLGLTNDDSDRLSR